MNRMIVVIIVLMILLVGCERNTEENKVEVIKEPNQLSSITNSLSTTPLTGNTYNVRAHLIYSGAHSEKKVALTFDDGPDSKYTSQILDILKKHNVIATFFVTGEHASTHKEIMKRIVENGHEIGNHSWDHIDLTKLDEQQLKEEIDRTDEMIQNFTGHPSTLLRPPYGAVSKQVIDYAEKSHRIVFWSVDTRDWEGFTSDRIIETVKKEIKPGAIILQHSAGGKNGNLSNTVKALPQLILYLKEQGYQLVTISNLIQ